MSSEPGSNSTKVLGVEWVPLYIPPIRRLQMLCVIFAFFIVVVLAGFGPIITIWPLFTSFKYISILYFIYAYFDWEAPKRGGHPWPAFRKWITWKYLADYFPMTLHKTADLDPEKNYVFGFHPHGMFSMGVFTNFCTDATGFSDKFPGIVPYPMTLAMQFLFPIRREVLMWLGCVDVSKESIRYVVNHSQKGHAAVISVGGTAEMFDARPGQYRINLTRRKGFIRLALEQGAYLVPVFSFGENDLYDQADYSEGSKARKIQSLFKNLAGFPPLLFYGRGIFNYNAGLLPYRRPVNTVVGKPIAVEQAHKPTQEQVDNLHSIYIKSLKELFEENKHKFGLTAADRLTIH